MVALKTRLHSSRMCTVRCSGCRGGMYPSMHWAGLCVSQHALGRGMYIPACTGQRGAYPSMHWAEGSLPHTPSPCGQNDRYLWKHYNYVADGNTCNSLSMKIQILNSSWPNKCHKCQMWAFSGVFGSSMDIFSKAVFERLCLCNGNDQISRFHY